MPQQRDLRQQRDLVRGLDATTGRARRSGAAVMTLDAGTTGTHPRDVRAVHAPFDRSVAALLDRSRESLAEAVVSTRAEERYVAAHLAALRAAAAVLAARARPQPRRGRPRSAWELLQSCAPELGEWAAFFAAGAERRAAAEAGVAVVTPRDADDLVRDAETFLALVETTLGLVHQPVLPVRRAG